MNLKEKLAQTKLELPEDFWQKIQLYKEHLFRWNKIHNLTGAKDEATVDDFIVDALLPLGFIQPPKTLLDIGTGAGFPGMILAFALPKTAVTLAEPLKKRASFLQFIQASLKLSNLKVEPKKAQELPPYNYELITSRAVTDTTLLLEISKNLRDENTTLLFYKGERVFDEIEKQLPHKVIVERKRHYLLINKEFTCS